MNWWEILLVAIAAVSIILVVGGVQLLIPMTMAWCFAFGFELVLNHGDWQVPLGVALIGAGTAYAFVTLHRLAYKDGWLQR